jgi:hypothetical protein
VTDYEAARPQVLRMEEFLPSPAERVWWALTDPDLVARWLMPNDFKLEIGHRFAIVSDPIRNDASDRRHSTRRIGAVSATVDAWRAAIRHLPEVLPAS